MSASTPSASSVSDRKSTRLNSSHQIISYAVFCLKKKKNMQTEHAKQVLFAHIVQHPGGLHHLAALEPGLVGRRDPRVVAELDFFFNDTATTEIYTLSLHDALPI